MLQGNDLLYKVGVTGVEESNVKLASLAGGFKDVLKTLGLVATATTLVTSTFKLFNAAVDNARVQDEAIKGLESRIKSTGGAAGITSKELQKMASELQNISNYGDEAIIDMQSLLLTFTNIKGDNFARTSKLVVDMSALMKKDLSSAAIQLGKALNDPATGLGLLSKTGITFTQSQKDVIKALWDTGQKAEAQGIILDALSIKMENHATAVSRSSTQMQNAFSDLLETVGTKFLSQLDGINLAYKNHLIQMNEDLLSSLNQEQDYLRQKFVFWNEATAGVITIFSALGKVLVTTGALIVGQIIDGFYLIPDAIGDTLRAAVNIVNNLGNLLRSVALGEKIDLSELVGDNVYANTKTRLQNLGAVYKGAAADYANAFKGIEKDFSSITWDSLNDFNIKLSGLKDALNGDGEGDGEGGGTVIADKTKDMLNQILADLKSFQTTRHAMSLTGKDQELALIELERQHKLAILRAGIADDEQYKIQEVLLNEMYGAKVSAVTQKYADQDNQIKEQQYQQDIRNSEARFQEILRLQDRFNSQMRDVDADYYRNYRLQLLQDDIRAYELAGVNEVFLKKWIIQQKKDIDRDYRQSVRQMQDQMIADWQETHQIETAIFKGIGSYFEGMMSKLTRITTDSKNDVERLFVDLANSIINELNKVLAKQIAVFFWTKLLGMVSGGTTAMFGGSGVDYIPSGNFASYTGGTGYVPTQLPLNPGGAEIKSLINRLQHLADVIENNPPQVYTQVIEGVPFDDAVQRARQKKNAL